MINTVYSESECMENMAACFNSFGKLQKYNSAMIEAIGDCPNMEIKVFPEPIFWESICRKSGWDCQVNIISGKARIVSPDNVRKGHGSRNAMLEKMNRLTDIEFLKRGDVIGVSRNGLYEHYAVYLGNGRVIHYCGEGYDFGGEITVHEADIDEFIKNSKTYFVVWFDEGRPVKLQKSTSFLFNSSMDFYSGSFQKKRRSVFSSEDTIKRAKSRIGEKSYNLIINNCEHFAMWCKTGVSESSQVKQIVKYALMTDLKIAEGLKYNSGV